jgi:hypothetical protein
MLAYKVWLWTDNTYRQRLQTAPGTDYDELVMPKLRVKVKDLGFHNTARSELYYVLYVLYYIMY